jgi:peptidyl-prolyl cis-trans isomerase B (cyclophilin B)
MVLMKMHTSRGMLDFELYDKDAPQTVAHIRELAKKGFYNGLAFFKHIPGMLIQTGCPHNDGTGHPGYFVKCELDENQRKHDFGVLSMAHTARNCNGSQFFICLSRGDADIFDRNHTCFGQLHKNGFDVLPKLRAGDTITKITVEEYDK